MRVLVVTLFSGENELADCIQSVTSQIGVEVVHRTIKNLPNREAHRELYRIFEEERANFSYLAKLDADMKFANPESLRNLLGHFRPGVDIVSVSVWDHITDTRMQSFNIFSHRCSFDYEGCHPLFADRVPITMPGRRRYIVDLENEVHHAFNSSDYQAFCFGVHRALKVVQRGERRIRIENAYHQLRVIRLALSKFKRTGYRQSYLACVGAHWVFLNKSIRATMRSKSDYHSAMDDALNSVSMESLEHALRGPMFFAVTRVVGWGRSINGAFDFMMRKGFRLPAGINQ